MEDKEPKYNGFSAVLGKTFKELGIPGSESDLNPDIGRIDHLLKKDMSDSELMRLLRIEDEKDRLEMKQNVVENDSFDDEWWQEDI